MNYDEVYETRLRETAEMYFIARSEKFTDDDWQNVLRMFRAGMRLSQLLEETPDRPMVAVRAMRNALLAKQQDKKDGRKAQAVVQGPDSRTYNDEKRFALNTIKKFIKLVEECKEGGRNNQLNESSFQVGRVHAGGFIGQENAIAALVAAAHACGMNDETEIQNTIESGFNAGFDAGWDAS